MMDIGVDDAGVGAERSARLIHAQVSQLREEIGRNSASLMEQWAAAIRRPDFVPFAENLACYLSLRCADLHETQTALAALGLSRLGRCESHVTASLDAVLASLSRIAGLPPAPYPDAAAFGRGHDLLAGCQQRIFGSDPSGPYTRIMVTLPTEAAADPVLVQQLICNGANCVRVNCAHDTPEAWSKMIAHTRAAAAVMGRDVRVLMDLAGPKIRIAEVHAVENRRLFPGDRFVITDRPSAEAAEPEVVLSHASLLAHLRPGTHISIDDGKLGAQVIARDGRRATLKVTHARPKGGKLKPEKGINLPGAELDIPALTEDDLRDLDFVAAHADIVGYSFVQTPEDVRKLAVELERRMNGKPLPALMLKIETPLAMRNLPRLIVQAGGVMPVAVMIARGDLAVEIGFGRLSEIQEEILWLCEAAHAPVVWATQVLDSMVKEGMATRAETTDAAMGQRAECVMLNKGPYLAKAVQFLSDILRRMDRHQTKKTARLVTLQSWQAAQQL